MIYALLEYEIRKLNMSFCHSKKFTGRVKTPLEIPFPPNGQTIEAQNSLLNLSCPTTASFGSLISS